MGSRDCSFFIVIFLLQVIMILCAVLSGTSEVALKFCLPALIVEVVNILVYTFIIPLLKDKDYIHEVSYKKCVSFRLDIAMTNHHSIVCQIAALLAVISCLTSTITLFRTIFLIESAIGLIFILYYILDSKKSD